MENTESTEHPDLLDLSINTVVTLLQKLNSTPAEEKLDSVSRMQLLANLANTGALIAIGQELQIHSRLFAGINDRLGVANGIATEFNMDNSIACRVARLYLETPNGNLYRASDVHKYEKLRFDDGWAVAIDKQPIVTGLEEPKADLILSRIKSNLALVVADVQRDIIDDPTAFLDEILAGSYFGVGMEGVQI